MSRWAYKPSNAKPALVVLGHDDLRLALHALERGDEAQVLAIVESAKEVPREPVPIPIVDL